MSPRTLVVFDFDWSLVDEDSDCVVLERLSQPLYAKLETMQRSMQWVDIMTQLIAELQDQGVTRAQIESALEHVPLRPAMIRVLELARLHDADVVIVSDANTEWIESVLRHYGVRHLVAHVITNEAEWRADGRLTIRPRVYDNDAHECRTIDIATGSHTCPPNLCKGSELERLLNDGDKRYQRVVYVGDGANDFCPSCRMSSNDVLCVRTGRVLEQLIRTNTTQVRANVKFWSDAASLLDIFTATFVPSVEQRDSKRADKQEVPAGLRAAHTVKQNELFSRQRVLFALLIVSLVLFFV